MRAPTLRMGTFAGTSATFALAVMLVGANASALPSPRGPEPLGSPASPGATAILAGEDPALGTTMPELGEAQGRELIGKRVARVEVVNVGGRWESSPTLKGVRAGDIVTPATARHAMREILATGRFARANVEALVEGEGVVLRIHVLPRRIIASIRVTGGSLETKDTLDAAEIGPGAEITAPMLATLEARIRRFYDQRGYPATVVHIDTTDTDQPDRVVVAVTVVPGAERRVAGRVFVIDPAIDAEVADLKNGYRVNKGARAEEPAFADADRDLGESLRQHGFFRADVRHTLREVGGQSVLYVFVNAGPRLVPAFEGNRAFDKGQLELALNLEKAPEARPGELVDRLRSFYVARGFLDAEVSMVEAGRPEAAIHYLAFTIREHSQVHVTRRIFPCLSSEFSAADVGTEIGSFLEEELPGAETFSSFDPRTLYGVVGPTTGTGGRGLPVALDPLRTYAPETYERALKHLRDLFHSKGYLNAVVGPIAIVRPECSRRSLSGTCVPVARIPVEPRCEKDTAGLPVPEPDVPETATCRPDEARGIECSPEITIRIPINLGPQTQLYDVAFDGNKSLSSLELAKIAAVSLGEPLSNQQIEAGRVRVLDAYRLRGFAYADVRTTIEPSPDKTRARARFYVTEREQVIVSGFVVKGATRTSEGLILRRVALRRNQPFRQDMARRTEARVATLGTFSSVSVGLEDADVPTRRKRVVITVVEQQPQYLEVLPGFSTGDGIRGTFEWGHRNIGGLAIGVALRARLSYLFDFLIPESTVRSYYDALTPLQRLERRNSLSLTFPEVGLGPVVSLTVDAIDLRDNQRDYALEKEAIVPTLTYRPSRQMWTQGGLATELNDVTIFNTKALNDTFGLLRAPEGRTVAIAERLAFTADYRDVPLNATKGFLFTTALEHVDALPAGTLGNKAVVKSHFLRFTGRAAAYLRVWTKGPTIALSVGAGYNQQLTRDSKTYPDRLFFLGGVDSLRAFLADTVVPEDVARLILGGAINQGTKQKWTINDVAIRGGDFSFNPRLELRVPIFDVIQAGLFLDTGNLWVDPSLIDLTQMRYALGAGLRIGTPIGPVAVDYGLNLSRRPWEDPGAFHFSIGLF